MNDDYSKKTIGYTALILAVTLFSTIEIASKAISHQAAVDPIIIVFIRFFSTGIVLLAVCGKSSMSKIKELKRRDYLVFILNGFIGVTLSITVFHIAILAFKNASSSAVVFSANPVFVMILARFINGESWTWRKWVAVGLGAIGIGCFAWECGSVTGTSLAGMLLMSLSAFLFALSICISKRVIHSYGPLLLMGFSALFGSLILLPVCFLRWDANMIEALCKTWPLISYISLVGTALAYGCYYFGIGRTSAYNGSMTFFLKPVMASVLSFFILGEHPNLYTIFGTTLIIGGLVLSVCFPGRDISKSAVPAAIEDA